jgi:UDP-glucuronate decarboxylase
MKILITGAAGFLGSHLTSRFLEEGHDVVGLDNFSTGSEKNISKFFSVSSFEFIKHDVREPLDIQFDGALNFACPASPIQYQRDPVRTIETNFLGMINLLRQSKKLGARLLQASTSEVYGDPEISPQVEAYWGNVNPIGIRSCYDEGKRAAETLCFDYLRQYSVDARVIRIFNTYGPNMAVGDGRVVSNFIVQALTGKPITIYGDGSQTRSFCYVDDLVDGIFKAFISPSFEDNPINLGNPTEFTMLDLAQTVLKVVGSSSEINFEDLPQDDPRQRKPDISKAKSSLGWEPKITLEEGIVRTVAYFRRELRL